MWCTSCKACPPPAWVGPRQGQTLQIYSRSKPHPRRQPPAGVYQRQRPQKKCPSRWLSPQARPLQGGSRMRARMRCGRASAGHAATPTFSARICKGMAGRVTAGTQLPQYVKGWRLCAAPDAFWWPLRCRRLAGPVGWVVGREADSIATVWGTLEARGGGVASMLRIQRNDGEVLLIAPLQPQPIAFLLWGCSWTAGSFGTSQMTRSPRSNHPHQATAGCIEAHIHHQSA